MARWEDIQAEVLRQDIDELKEASKAVGAQKGTYEGQIEELQNQLATVEKGSNNKTLGLNIGKKAKQKQKFDQLKQKFGSNTRSTIGSRSSKRQYTGDQMPDLENEPHSETTDENVRLLKIAEDFELAMLIRDRQGMKRALGTDTLEVKRQALDEKFRILNDQLSTGKAGSGQRVMRQAVENLDEIVHYNHTALHAARLLEKVQWTVLTKPRFGGPEFMTYSRLGFILALPFRVLRGRWMMFKVCRQQRKLKAVKRKFQFILDRRL